MKYKEIVKIIKNISLALPDVQSFYTGDVYEVNADQSIKYSSIVLTNQEHSFDNVNDRFQYNFILFYIDRLTDDEANRVDVHTAAVSALKAIVQRLEDYNVIINDFKFNLFRERFNDSCAGAYATLSVEVEDNDCNEEFDFSYGQITPDKLKEISITTNGTYTPSDGYYYSKVTVNVQPSLQTKAIEITENGTSTIVADSEHYGLKAVDVSVNVPTPTFETEELSVTANGTYTPTTDGYSKVEVNVKGADKIIVPNGMKFSLSSAFNPELFDVSQVSDMSQFFYKCDRIKSLDLSSWNTPSVTNLGSAFNGCHYLVSLDISSWNVEKVTSMTNLFYGCTGLTSLNISNWRVSELLTMNNLFYNCQSIGSLDLSGFNVSKVTNFGNIFSDCKSLVSLNLSNWNMSRMTYATDVFHNCPKLTDLNMNGAILPKMDIKFWALDTCKALTVESIVSVLNALPQLEDVPYTCAIGSANIVKLSDEQRAIATNKNWILN